ncbi:D-alanyl-D-alanine carboxypeptidase family protein [Anoxybacteroides tepidamans]|uniref:M15 family metallopeptidase n=1 Tax=Anoxybacteroides tepidamans TaxID=265948 RepID=UPI00048705F8|nr:M15 family metallopeptidase [Anoxybacillus tepidamans]
MKKILILITAACFLSSCATQQDSQPKESPVKQTPNQPSNEQSAHEQANVPQQSNNHEQGTNEAIDPDLLLESKYWNVVKVQNGMKVIMNPANILALVNKEQSLPSSYKPSDLVTPNVPFSFSETNVEKRHMRLEAAKALEQLFAAARQAGIQLVAVSGYRSYERQKVLFDEEVKKNGKEKAVHAVAIPGQSEHQTGLAMDISSTSTKGGLTAAFGDTKEGKWVASHAHEYGFIIRYPKGKEAVTGYEYEPWHLRYVGKKAAKVIFEKGITLEEYFQIVKKV